MNAHELVEFLRKQDLDGCCADSLDRFEATLVTDARFYGTVSFNESTGAMRSCPALVMRPDRNSNGIITHFHFEFQDEQELHLR